MQYAMYYHKYRVKGSDRSFSAFTVVVSVIALQNLFPLRL